jgi:hypothetical protein
LVLITHFRFRFNVSDARFQSPEILEMTPNDLFGVSAKMDGEVSQLNSWAMKTALRLRKA